MRIKQRIRIANHLWETRSVGSNHRGATTHSLKRWQPETFVPRRKDKRGTQVVQADEFLLGYIACEDKFARIQAMLTREKQEPFATIFLHCTYDCQLVGCTQWSRKFGVCPDQAFYVLTVIYATCVHHEFSIKSVSLPQAALSLCSNCSHLEMTVGIC